MALIIKWNNKAIKHFDEAIEYIQLSSPANAEKVKREILLAIDVMATEESFSGVIVLTSALSVCHTTCFKQPASLRAVKT